MQNDLFWCSYVTLLLVHPFPHELAGDGGGESPGTWGSTASSGDMTAARRRAGRWVLLTGFLSALAASPSVHDGAQGCFVSLVLGLVQLSLLSYRTWVTKSPIPT